MWWPPDSDVVATTSLSGGHHILSGGHQIAMYRGILGSSCVGLLTHATQLQRILRQEPGAALP